MSGLTLIVSTHLRQDGSYSPAYEARLNGDLICVSERPFVDAARILLARGIPGESVLVMRHAGSAKDSLRSTIATAAALTVIEPDRGGGPRLASYEAFPRARARIQIAQIGSPLSDRAEPRRRTSVPTLVQQKRAA